MWRSIAQVSCDQYGKGEVKFHAVLHEEQIHNRVVEFLSCYNFRTLLYLTTLLLPSRRIYKSLKAVQNCSLYSAGVNFCCATSCDIYSTGQGSSETTAILCKVHTILVIAELEICSK